MSFIAGQRWVSAAEPELGLGVVVDADARQVRVVFPAAGEQRAYAVRGAPLSRVCFEPGDQILTDEGAELEVLARREQQGCFIYAVRDGEGREAEVDELDLASEMQLARPHERLFSGQLDGPEGFSLRARVLEARHRLQGSPVAGLLGPRVSLLPHQLYIASEVGRRHAPRVLLADEVGLGKTVEAGMVMHQKLLRGECSRVLVLVPESLLHQWLVEMLRRFNLLFSLLDEERLTGHEGEGNVFDTQQLWLCSLEFALAQGEAAEQALAADWDVLVVDEAHHLTVDAGVPSPAYRLVAALAARIPSVLLLTATPSRLGTLGHFARLRLLDPARFSDVERFEEEQRGYRRIGPLAERLNRLADETAPAAEEVDAVCEVLAPLLGPGIVGPLAAAAGSAGFGMAARMALQQLLDRHGTGRLLFRNTRNAVGGFAPRRLRPHALIPPPAWPGALAAAGDVFDALRPEMLLGEAWLTADPRVAWLEDFLAEHSRRKVLLICARDDTARTLEQHLRVRRGLRACVFHAGMELIARDRAAAWFAQPVDGAQILICSEIGSEGRNFQHAHDLVMFDLPASLELLEQRIGRLDRIGQTEVVALHVPYYEDSAQAVMLRWLHEGLDALQAPFPAPQRAGEVLDAPLRACIGAPEDADGVDALIAQSRRFAVEVREEMEHGRDRLLEINSFHPVRGHDLRTEVMEAGRPTPLRELLEPLLDRLGVEMEAQDAQRVLLRPGEHLEVSALEGLPEDGLTAAWERAHALAHEDTTFLTWEHPLVRSAMGLLLDSGFGNASVARLPISGLAAGTVLVEALFLLHCPAPPALALERHVPTPLLRVVVDAQGRDLGSALSREALDRIAVSLPPDTAMEVLTRVREPVMRSLSEAEAIVTRQAAPLVEDALSRARAERGAEIERLEALAEVNDGVREEEIAAAREARDLALERLASLAPRLDAVRVGVVG